MRSRLILLTPRRKKVGRWKEVLCVKWEMKPNDTAGEIVCGHRTPAPRQQSRPRPKNLWRAGGGGSSAGLYAGQGIVAGWHGGEMLDPQVCQAGG